MNDDQQIFSVFLQHESYLIQHEVATVPACYVRTLVICKRIYQMYVRERYVFTKRKRISPERLNFAESALEDEAKRIDCRRKVLQQPQPSFKIYSRVGTLAV